MSIQPRTEKLFEKVWVEANFHPVQLITRTEFSQKTGRSCSKIACAECNPGLGVFWVRQNDNDEEIMDSIWHEMIHCIFPNLPEWWVECAAHKLSRNATWSCGPIADKYNKGHRDVPPRKKLVEMIRDSSYEMNKRLWH